MRVADGRLTIGEARDTTDRELYRVGRWEQGRGQPVPQRQAAPVDRDLRPRLVGLRRGAAARLGSASRRRRPTASSPSTSSPWPTCSAITGPVEVPIYGQHRRRQLHPEARRRLRRLPRQRGTPRPQPGPRPALRRAPPRRRATASRRSSPCATPPAVATSPLWMRDPDVQAAVADIGLTGELSDTDHDYLARLQPEHQPQQVRLLAAPRGDAATYACARTARPGCGSTVSVHNDSPPYAGELSGDPRGGASLHPLERHDASASSCPRASRSTARRSPVARSAPTRLRLLRPPLQAAAA